jgi:hypothetical protein
MDIPHSPQLQVLSLADYEQVSAAREAFVDFLLDAARQTRGQQNDLAAAQ